MERSSNSWLTLKKYGYLACLIPIILPAISIPLGLFFQKPNAFSFFPVGIIFFLIPLVDYFIGKDTSNPNQQQQETLAHDFYYRALTLLCLPLLVCLMYLGSWYFASGHLSFVGKIGWILSVGTATGGVGIVAAHELVHKNSRLERTVGGLLLSLVCYATFKVEHLRGHHVFVATEHDASSAKYNQTLYAFLLDTFQHNFINGWRLEAERLTNHRLPIISWHNELIGWYLISVALATSLVYFIGWIALLFFLAQSVVAIALLETINYVEHYGLSRQRLSNGRYETVSIAHSWNSGYLFSNLVLFQLQRHSDHHVVSKRRYQNLINHHDSPELPAGYPTMVLLAFLPPLWFKIIHPRLPMSKSTSRC